jgi:hypothetical protein
MFMEMYYSWPHLPFSARSQTVKFIANTQMFPTQVFRIRIHMFLGLLDPDPLGMDQDQDPSIIKQKYPKNLDSYCFVTSFGLFIYKNDLNEPSK